MEVTNYVNKIVNRADLSEYLDVIMWHSEDLKKLIVYVCVYEWILRQTKGMKITKQSDIIKKEIVLLLITEIISRDLSGA